MNLHDLIIAIRKLFGIESTVESITKPFTKVANKLDKHSVAKTRAAASHDAAAAALAAKAASANAEAKRAAAAREKFANLTF